MNTALVSGSGLAMWLALSAAVRAAEPPAAAVQTAAPAPSKPAAAPSGAPAESLASGARKPLDLRIGNVRNYMMPSEYRAALEQPDADNATVVVEGQRLVPMNLIENVPPGLFGLWYAV